MAPSRHHPLAAFGGQTQPALNPDLRSSSPLIVASSEAESKSLLKSRGEEVRKYIRLCAFVGARGGFVVATIHHRRVRERARYHALRARRCGHQADAACGAKWFRDENASDSELKSEW
jgi:hypothetical protein